MLLKATFPSSYFGLVGATPAAKKKWVFFGTVCYKFMSVKNTSLTQQRSIYSTPFRRTVHAYSPSKRCDHASQKQAQTAKCLANHLYLPTLPRQFVPDSIFGLLRSARISTAISVPPLQSTQSLCIFSELAATRSRQVIHILIPHGQAWLSWSEQGTVNP